jgi:tRNA threonylcarbamoyladenosine modification (KEOPS) complex  Pcc1 subunit
LENLGDFVFNIRFTIKDRRFIQSIPKLLDLELKNLDDSSSRVHDLHVMNDSEGNVTIQVLATDMTGFKIAANSINRYIEIIGKVIELVQKEPSLPKSKSNGS